MDQLIPFSVRAILDDPPLMRGEDEAAYRRLAVIARSVSDEAIQKRHRGLIASLRAQ